MPEIIAVPGRSVSHWNHVVLLCSNILERAISDLTFSRNQLSDPSDFYCYADALEQTMLVSESLKALQPDIEKGLNGQVIEQREVARPDQIPGERTFGAARTAEVGR